jgi:hypothetical protein
MPAILLEEHHDARLSGKTGKECLGHILGTDHELRAALICLLTAALADKGVAAIIGEAEGGWFWLPPWSMWQPWAKDGLESAEKWMASKVIPLLEPRTPRISTVLPDE